MAPRKQPETVDRFRIHAETSLESMGPLLAQLTRMGLENIQYELVTDVLEFAVRTASNGEAEGVVRAWIAEHPTFKLSELSAHCVAQGRISTTQNHTIKKMLANGELKALGGGHYQRSDVKAIAPPEEAEKQPHANAGRASPRFEISGIDAIWRHIKNRKKPFKVVELRALFRAQGRNENSASPLMITMQEKGLIKPAGEKGSGEYVVVPGARPEKKEKKARNPSTKKPAGKSHYEVSNRDLILNHIGTRKAFGAAEIAELFGKSGRPPKSASSVLSQMRAAGDLKATGIGQYEVVPKNTNGTGAGQAHG